MNNRKVLTKNLMYLFFMVFIIEVTAEYLVFKPLILIFKPLIPLVIIMMYMFESEIKSKIYVLIMFLSLVTNLLFIPNTDQALFYALLVFTLHRILLIIFILKMNKKTDFVPLIIATLPFLIVFSYLYFETPTFPENNSIILIVQNVLISIFAGISLSGYVMNDYKQNSILLISALLFVLLQFSVFIEKFYLENEYSQVLRPLSMSLNAMAFFSFYRYVIEAEKAIK